MRLIKYGSGSCGPCGRMSHYDYKVAEELGLPFTYIKKNTNEYKTQGHIVSQLRSVPNPTYVLVDNEDKVLGHFSGASDKGAFRRNVQKVLDKTPEKKTTVLKLSTTNCGICGRMAKFDQSAVEQLGYELQTVNRSDTEKWKKYQYVLDQIYGPEDVIGFPSYIAVEGTDETDMVVLGEVRGGMDKGKFKEKIQLVIKNRGSEPRVEPGDENCKYWKVRCECGCSQDEGESGLNPIWTIKYYEDENLPGSDSDYEIISTHENTNACKDNKCISLGVSCFCNFPDLNNGDIRDGLCTLTCYKKKEEPDPCKDAGAECGKVDGESCGDCPAGKKCENNKCVDDDPPAECDKNFTLVLDCPKDCDKESGTRTINANADGIANANVSFAWYKGAAEDGSGDKIAEGMSLTSVDVNCPPAGQSQKYACQAKFKDGLCEITRTENCVISTDEDDGTEPPPPEPTPPPDVIDPDEYDCKCPPETIQLWYDAERGVYGSSYDKDRISSIQYIDAWKDTRALKLWLRPGGCNLDDVCKCVNLCSTTTAGGYDILDMDVKCETNKKENSVTLTFSGTYLQDNGDTVTAKPKGEMDTNPLLWVGPERCEPNIRDIRISSGKICPKGNGEVVTFEIDTTCCEPNNGKFSIDAGGGKETLKGMDGVSFPGAGDGPNDHGSGQEIKQLRIKCDEFKYDIKDHDWIIYWEGDCDQEPGSSFDIDHTFKASSSCDEAPEPDKPEPECKTDEDCPDGQVCVDGKCVKGCNDDGDCGPGFVCVDGQCISEFTEVSVNFYPNCLSIQCCPDCDDEIPPFEPGDNDDCTNKPEPNPVPGTDGPAATVYLYDRLNHTYVFCCPILADVTWLLPFDSIPPIFQRYITAAATVRAAAQLVNNPQLFQILKDRENTLRMECMNYELEQGDLTFLGQPDHTAYVGYQPIQTLNR